MTMTVGSLFSGIGGFDLGLERAGMKVKWQVENDKFCNKILEKHWPDVKRYGDIREVGGHNLEPVDLICGGFPCQPFSVAGKQRGTEDDRYLWPEMFRIIQELKPRWVLGENVTGLVRMGLDDCLSDLEGEGYTVQTFIVPACAVNAPHRRDRLWIVAWNSNSDIKGEDRTVQKREKPESGRVCPDVADSPGEQRKRNMGGPATRGERLADSGKNVNKSDIPVIHKGGPAPAQVISDAQGVGLQGFRAEREQVAETSGGEGILNGHRGIGEQWATEPDVGRVASRVPHRVDRLKALGNAVVPQEVELIARAIQAADG